MSSSVPASAIQNTASQPFAAAQPPSPKPSSGFSFHDLLDIVNPLQHLPVIGTLYRAITGEHIGKLEKVAGDALYGGLWGAVSSVADLAFEAVTGKDFGDTVLALFSGHGSAKAPAAVAQNTITVPKAAANPPAGTDTIVPGMATTGIAALTSALQQKGIDSDIAQRALFAYRQSMNLPSLALAAN